MNIKSQTPLKWTYMVQTSNLEKIPIYKDI